MKTNVAIFNPGSAAGFYIFSLAAWYIKVQEIANKKKELTKGKTVKKVNLKKGTKRYTKKDEKG